MAADSAHLMLCCEAGNLDQVLFDLVKTSASIDQGDLSPLHFSVRYGHTRITRLLLDNGGASSVNSLDWPIANNHLHAVRSLVENGQIQFSVDVTFGYIAKRFSLLLVDALLDAPEHCIPSANELVPRMRNHVTRELWWWLFGLHLIWRLSGDRKSNLVASIRKSAWPLLMAVWDGIDAVSIGALAATSSEEAVDHAFLLAADLDVSKAVIDVLLARGANPRYHNSASFVFVARNGNADLVARLVSEFKIDFRVNRDEAFYQASVHGNLKTLNLFLDYYDALIQDSDVDPTEQIEHENVNVTHHIWNAFEEAIFAAIDKNNSSVFNILKARSSKHTFLEKAWEFALDRCMKADNVALFEQCLPNDAFSKETLVEIIEVAIARNSVKIFKHLLTQHPTFATESDDYLITSCQRGRTEIASLLIQAGSKDPYTDAFLWSCRHGNLDCVKLLHENNLSSVNAKNGSPLVWSATNSHLSVILWLLEHGADPNLKETSCLGYAVQSKCWEGAEALVAAGANVNGSDGYLYALVLATNNKKLKEVFVNAGAVRTAGVEDMLQQLGGELGVESENEDEEEGSEKTEADILQENSNAVMDACEAGDFETVEELLETTQVDLHIYDDSPFRFAARFGYWKIVKLLVENYGIDPYCADDGGIGWTVQNNHLRTLHYLTRIKRVYKTGRGGPENTFLQVVINGRFLCYEQLLTSMQEECLEQALYSVDNWVSPSTSINLFKAFMVVVDKKARAETKKSLLDALKEEISPLIYAVATRQDIQEIEALLSAEQVQDKEEDRDNQTVKLITKYALLLAVILADLPTVQLLVSKNAAPVSSELIPFAAVSSSVNVLTFLLENGGDIHACEDHALYVAAREGNLEVVQELLKRYSAEEVDEGDMDAFQVACEVAGQNNHEDVVQLLKSAHL
ncbi:UNVERIFIED_CONTAM: hypothetical protein HDU68_011295 [Siphonaria sp. JEL0065]|nr:hypothetical protein HDU68_011295 [Siphonaria sp. JEL0065]